MLKQKFILNFISKVFLQVLQIAASILVARLAGPTVLGTVAFGTAYVGSFIFISGLGLGSAHTKLISEGQNESDCLTTYSILRSITICIFIIVVTLFFFSQKYIFNYQFESKIHQYVIFITLIAATIQSISQIATGTFTAKVEIAKATIIDSARMFIFHILRIIIVLLGYKALTLALGKIISFIIIIPLILYLFKDYSFGKFDKKLAKKYISIALPTLLIMFSENLMHTLDRVILQFFHNSEQVGYYTAGYKIGGLLMMLTAGVSPFFPIFSKAYANNKLSYIKDKIYKYERFIFIFIMPLIIFIAIYADSIIKLVLGKQYINSITTMSIITVAMFVKIIIKPYSNVLTGKGLFNLTAIISIIQLILFVIALVIFIHPSFLGLKATGGAIAFLAANLFAGLIYVFFAKRNLPILKITKNMHFMLFGIINFIGFYLLYNYFVNKYGINFRIAFPFIYFIVTYLLLLVLRWINKEDFDIFKSMVDLRTMKKYIYGELKNKNK